MTKILLFISAALACWPAMARKAEPSGLLVKAAETYAVTQQFGRKKIMVHGKEWDAQKYCNEQTMANPSQLELYFLNKKSVHVVLCPGTKVGEENVISVFPKSGWPKTRRVKPAKNSARVSEEVLRNSVIRLMKK